MKGSIWLLVCCGTLLTLQVSAAPLIEYKDTLECEPILRPMNIQQNSAHLATRCFKALNTLACVPGLTLVVDRVEGNDLCVNQNGTPVSAPKCITEESFDYIQEIIQRRFLPVTTKEGTTSQWVDIPFSSRRMKAKLTQQKPLVQPGPDACIYRLLTKILGMKRTDHFNPKARPPQHPVRPRYQR